MRVRTFYLPLTCISVLLLSICSGVLSAQPSLILAGEPNAENFPLVSSLFYAVGADSIAATDITVDQVVVSENGKGRKVVSVTCPPSKPPVPISSVLALDVSGSMLSKIEGQSYTRLALVQEGARTWVQELDLRQSECAITTFHKRSSLELGFSSNRNWLLSTIDKISASGGTDYNQAFIGIPAGGLTIAAQGKLKRVLVLLTDGESQGNEDVILDRARAANVQVYCIAAGLKAPLVLRNIAEGTGGLWFENVSTIDQIKAIYRLILQHSQETGVCQVVWQSEKECERIRDVFINIPDLPAFALTKYHAPPISPNRPWTNKPELVFRDVPLGGESLLTLDIAARDTLIIDELRFDGPEFVVVEKEDDPNFLPQTILPGDTLQLTVRYTPLVAVDLVRELTIGASSSCAGITVFCIGSFEPLVPRDPIRLIHPNGGEEFLVGVDTVIQWGGVFSTDPVRLEYSVDDGRTWMEITPRTVGLTYPWNVPNTPSRECLARVTVLNPDRVTVEMPHPRRVVGARFAENGNLVVTLDEIATVRVWNPYSGDLLQEILGSGIASHLEVSQDGRFVAVAESSGGTVTIHDLQNIGSPVRLFSSYIFNAGQASELKAPLAFSPDNTSLLVGKFDNQAQRSTNLIRFYDPQTGAFQKELAPEHWSRCVAFSKNQAAPLLATGGVNGYVEVWNPDLTKRWTLRIPNSGDVVQIDLDENNSRLIAVAEGRSGGSIVAYWNMVTGELISAEPYPIRVTDMDLGSTPAGVAALMVQGDPVVRNMPSGKVDREIIGHSAPVNSARFSDNGDRILTASDDFTARIWAADSAFQRSDVSDSLWAIVVPEVKSYDVDFGNVPTGHIADSILVTYVENRSTITVDVLSMTIVGRDRGDFRVVSVGAPFTLNAGAGKDVEIEFYPQREGTFEATAVIETNVGTLQQRLIGTSTMPALKIVGLIGDFIDFGPVPIGQFRDSAAWAVNTSQSAVDVRELLTTGPDDVQFEVRGSNPNLPTLLPPGDSIEIFVRFAPQRLGLTQGGADLLYNGNGSPALLGLFGEGISASDPAIDVVTVLSYSTQQCVMEPDTLTVEVSNPGSNRLEVSGAEITGVHALDFQLVTPFVPFGVEPNETQSIAIVFRPLGAGQRSATMRLHSNASNAPQHDLALRGAVEYVEIAVVETTVDLGRLCLTEEQNVRLMLTNTGNIGTVVNVDMVADPNAAGTFELDANRVSIADGDSVEVMVRVVAGQEPGRGFGKMVIHDSICGERVEVLIQWEVGMPALTIDSVPVVCAGAAVELSVRGADTYQWEYAEELSCLDCANPVVTAQQTRTYYVRGYDAWGCSVQDSVQVRVREGNVELGVRIDRKYRTRPGDSVAIVVELVDPVPDWGLVDNLELRVGYDPTVLVVHEKSIENLLTNTLLAGWTVDEISDHVYGELVVRLSAPNGVVLTGTGALLEVHCRPFFANVTGTELPLQVTTSAGCLGFVGEAGYVQVDSICGLHYRLFEVGLGKYSLGEGMQNPVQGGVARIPFSIGLDGETVVEVYDNRGTQVGVILVEHLKAGTYHILWDVSTVSSGLYYCRLTSGHWSQIKSLVVQQ